MKEVSCRVFQSLPLVEREFGITKEEICSWGNLQWTHICNPHNRIDWDQCLMMMDKLYDRLASEAKFIAFISRISFKDTTKYNKLSGLFFGLSSIYTGLIPIILRRYYGIPLYSAAKQADGSISVSITIPNTHASSRRFLVGAGAVLIQAPTIVGLTPARIEQQITDRLGVYRVYPPPDKNIWQRLRVLPSTIVAGISFLRILNDQNTELTVSNRLLEQQTTNLQNILVASSDGIAVVRDGLIIHANPGLAHLLRAPSVEAVLGQRSDRWVATNKLDELRAWAATQPPENERREVALKLSPEVSIIVEFSAPRLIIWENQPATLWLIRDITERHDLEKALATARQREQSSLARDLHDGLGQHLTGLAFKLKALETRLAQAGSPEAVAATEMLSLANQATTQARDLAHGLAPVDLDPQGLVPALRHLASSVSQLFQLRCTFASDGPQITLPREIANQLYRATQEAITNAHRHGRAKIISLILRQAPSELTLLIDDNGTGLPADFNPSHSSGMGLKIMHYRLSSVEGSFNIGKSPTLDGIRVKLSVPLKREANTQNHPIAATPGAQPAASHAADTAWRVLLVDDHAVVRAGLGQLLNQTRDFTLCGDAANSAAAESACRDLTPDLVITDLLLGEENAIEMIRRLRTEHPALGIVALSMYGKEHYEEVTRAAGADAYVMKQAAPDELLAVLRRVCSERSPVP